MANGRQDSHDRSRVVGDKDYEVQHFASQAGITSDQARELIKHHGNDRAKLLEVANCCGGDIAEQLPVVFLAENGGGVGVRLRKSGKEPAQPAYSEVP